MVSRMTFVYLAGTGLALVLLIYGGARAVRALEQIQAGLEGVRAAFLEPQDDASPGELDARIAAQDAKIDRLTVGWVDFLGKYERTANRIEGAQGHARRRARARMEEEQNGDADHDDDARASEAQRMLPLPVAVASGAGPRALVFAPLPSFRLKG